MNMVHITIAITYNSLLKRLTRKADSNQSLTSGLLATTEFHFIVFIYFLKVILHHVVYTYNDNHNNNKINNNNNLSTSLIMI